jgi:hypothetical protein
MVSLLQFEALKMKIPAGPCVGIFWFVRDGDGIAMITEGTPLATAEEYGDFATHATGHYSYWERLKRRGPDALRRGGMPDAPAWYEYEDFPRGRIVYSRVTHRFTVYVDPKLKSAVFTELIALAFGLLPGEYDIGEDAHYRSSQFLPGMGSGLSK